MAPSAVLTVAAVVATLAASVARAQDLMAIAARANAADSARRFAEAARLWRQLAAISGGDPIGFYLEAASATHAGNREASLAALRQAIDEGLVLPFSLRADTTFRALHGDRRWAELASHADRLAAARDTALRAELLALAARDQQNRAGIDAVTRRFGVPSPQADSALAAMTAADQPIQQRLREIVRARGWPGRRLVGDDGAHAAWLLLQHADSAHQRAMLPVLQAATRRGDARPGDVALLDDRVRTNQGRPQLYGSQLRYPSTPGAAPTVHPIEDAACVDRRRAAVRLPPLAEYLRQMGARDKVPSGRCRR
jgi:hypothetical protein